MSKTSMFCVLAVAFALAGCNHFIFLEEETPPGRVPPPAKAEPVAAVPDAGPVAASPADAPAADHPPAG